MFTVYVSLHISYIVSNKNGQNSTWKSLHVSDNMVYSEICHKYIHIMGWKDQTSKEIATCEKLDSLSSCCEQAAAGMVRAFPAHFVPLQSDSTQCNVHKFTCSYRELCEMWHFIWNISPNILQNIVQNTSQTRTWNVWKRVRSNV